MTLTTFVLTFAMGPVSSGGQRGQEICLADFVRPIQQVRFRSAGGADFSSLGSLIRPELFSAKIFEASNRLKEARRFVSTIKIGMKRAEVERIFTRRDGGFRMSNTTRYCVEPETLIVVPYDHTGGNGSPLNRVDGPIKVYRSACHVH